MDGSKVVEYILNVHNTNHDLAKSKKVTSFNIGYDQNET